MKPELIIDAPILGEKKIWVKKVYKPHFDHPFHFHKLCELTWVLKGHGQLILGDYVGGFADGEIILAGPELPHLWKCDAIYYEHKKNFFTKAYGMYFPAELAGMVSDDATGVHRYNNLMQKAERGLRFYGKTKAVVTGKLKEVVATNGLQQLGIFLQIIDILSRSEEYEVLASVGYKRSLNINDIERFNEVYQFLLKNFHRDIMLEEVAGICNMTSSSFCRFFKQKTQKTFTYFLNELRVGHAKKLLQNENYRIKDIGYECGYNNPVHFFNFFKQIVKQTPKEFRDNVLKR
ncbi:AraC family transcriptional regulator [Chitinophaga sp.]|uniref:AraC family transcriptional regulator n=1 Tax=Chitinophaga sp. TaxID=1869181 RepID=UPI0031DC9969